MERKIRQPIVTVAGHIDHGKTTLLDCIAGTCEAEKEPGLITQKISFMVIPAEAIKKKCESLLKKFQIKIEVPGFLFIDTPGHAAFTNLRRRGGALADLAILVVDINEGIMEQTKESIEILMSSKVPFVVALNKIDKLPGWRKFSDLIKENIEMQAEYTKKEFEKKLYHIITQFSQLGFNSDLFFRITDFKKQLALIPCSAKTSEGLQELIVMLAGLAQKFLKERITIKEEEAKGTILEVKKEKGIVEIEAILYDGVLKKDDLLIISTFDEPIVTKIRALQEAKPFKKGFIQVDKVTAAAGIRISLPSEITETIIPGMPFSSAKQEDIERIKKELKKEIQGVLTLDKEGIVVKAESLGSLEALVSILRKEGIKVKKAGIGNITKQDIAIAKTNLEINPLDAVILGFNVKAEETSNEIKIITSEIIYRLIEELEEWRKTKQIEIEREKIEELKWPCKLFVLPKCCFRKSKPAIFGVRIEAGILKPDTPLINKENEEIAKVKSIQSEGKNLEKAVAGQEVAISLPNITFGRQVKEEEFLYSDLTEEEFKKLKENKKFLTKSELDLLQEIVEIKRKIKPTWGI